MKEDLTYIITLIMLCREHPHLLQRLCYILGCFSKTVGLDGLPSDPETNRKNSNLLRKDAAWLHRQIDFEVDIGTHTTKGFYSYLTEQGKLWRILE